MWEEAAPEDVLFDGRRQNQEPVWQRVSSAVSNGARRLRTSLSNIGKDVADSSFLPHTALVTKGRRSRASQDSEGGEDVESAEFVTSLRSVDEAISALDDL
jgi:hypothetical protein